jgi:hypothetical protein
MLAQLKWLLDYVGMSDCRAEAFEALVFLPALPR